MSTQSVDQKRELLARRLRNQAQQTIHPLSHNQKALWFMNQLAPDSWAYITIFTARIISAVDLSALERAFAALARRHAILRTTYHVQNGEPVQRVGSEPTVDLAVVDAATWSEQELQERITLEAHRPFDLERGPVSRVAMFHLASGEFILLFAVHHIAVDYWSQSVLLEDLGVLYAEACGNAAAALPPLKAQYTDFVRWQADLLQSAEGEQQQAFWLDELGGELAVLNLPTDHQAPPVQRYRGATFTFQVDSGLSDRLEALAKAEGATLFVTLLAAYQVMLHRYSGQDDIVVGTPTAGRSRAEFEGAAGYFANPVVLRGDFSGAPSFRTLIRQLRTTTSEAIARADYPFPLLASRVQPQRDPSRSPLFQALFALQRAARLEQQDLSAFFMGDQQVSLNLGGLIMKSFPMQQQEGQFELKLYMAKSPNGMLGALQYSTDLFDESTIARMAGHYLNLLQAVVADPDQEVAVLPLLAEGERRQLVEWHDDTRDYPPCHSLIDLFEAQVAQLPDAVALVYGEQRLTYQELNRRANQVAHSLRKQGVGPEVLVGLSLPRSLEMVIGILGILKAGGAYVPLDPAYPQERLAFIREDAGLSLVLSQETDWEAIRRE
ncbi:MAG: Amino acid adenylation, partial [Firmicutes bacterium]|nr:Amino acid adenylation [Bacillota bacterium]